MEVERIGEIYVGLLFAITPLVLVCLGFAAVGLLHRVGGMVGALLGLVWSGAILACVLPVWIDEATGWLREVTPVNADAAPMSLLDLAVGLLMVMQGLVIAWALLRRRRRRPERPEA